MLLAPAGCRCRETSHRPWKHFMGRQECSSFPSMAAAALGLELFWVGERESPRLP